MSSHVKYTLTKNDVIYLQSFDDTYQALTLLFHLNSYELVTIKERGLHFILSDNDNYNFDVKVERCGFMGFINNVIDCGRLGCVFCFRIKEKKENTFYINFYSIIFLQSCFFFFFSLLQLNNFNGYMCAIYNCCFL